MESKYTDFERLVEKFIQGDLSDEEQEKLDSLLNDKDNKSHFKEMLSLNYRLNKRWLKIEQAKKDKLFAKIMEVPPVKKLNPYQNLLRIAAIFAILLGGAVLYYASFEIQPVPEQVVTLDLDTGVHKQLEKGAKGVIAETNGVRIEQRGDTLTYITKNQDDVIISFDEIHVPYGKSSVVALADGTLINLNAGSSLRYPNGFKAEGNREVFLTGEAYFQVSHDAKRPFLVHTDDLEIEVLGTHFNVQAYADEKNSNTVLVNGVVKVKQTANPEDAVVLKPGMQASYSRGSKSLEIASVNTAPYIAWVKGQLYFDQADFTQIARVLERKFDVQIQVNNTALKKEKFTAKFKAESLEQILKSFNESYPFNYDIKQNTVVIN
ncbi:MAG: FecR domain-containing protein [Zunongwangia sp.]|uniref:FecR family protein n=1 Tax=Zunongwangia sp. TaxID=1965325 RepID=UPI0032423861